MHRPRLLSLVVLCWSGLAWSDQGASVAALTPGRDGHAEVHLEIREDSLASELLKAPAREQFRALLKAGQGKVTQVTPLDISVEGVHTVLAFDQSASFRPHLNDAMALAQKFLAASPPNATFTILSFGTSLGEPQDAPSPTEAQRYLAAVAKSTPQYQTRLKASIRESTAIASQRRPMPRGARQVLVFTDAGEESSVYTAEQVITEARQRGVRVHAVVLGTSKGTSLAQRRDDMKRLSEDTGGYNIEVRDRASASAQIEIIARSSRSLLRLALDFCEVPPSPPLRDEQIQIEVLRAGAVVASTSWTTFSQQASGAALRSCSPVATPSAAPVASVAPPLVDAPPPARFPLFLFAGLSGLGLLAAVLALVFRGRVARPTPPAPPAPALESGPVPPLPTTTPWVNPSAAPLAPEPPRSAVPDLWLVIVRAPTGQGGLLRAKNGLVIGAAPGCDLRLDVNEVSSRHAVLEITRQGDVYLLDQGSTNGTFLDGQRLASGQRVPWKLGQVASFSTKVDVRMELR